MFSEKKSGITNPFQFLLVRLKANKLIASDSKFNLFQFLLVRLKVKPAVTKGSIFNKFQFLLVRLKERYQPQ